MSEEIAVESSQALAQVMGDVLPEIEDPEQAQRAIVERILAAPTAEDVWQDATSTATRELIGVPILINDYRLMRSNLEEGRGVYMLLDVVRQDTGEIILANTGAPQIMATVFRRKQLGSLPLECEVVEVAAAKPGRSAPLGIKPTGAELKRVTAAKRK